MFCRFCGARLPDDSVFCENCGARLDGAPAPAAAPQQNKYRGQEPSYEPQQQTYYEQPQQPRYQQPQQAYYQQPQQPRYQQPQNYQPGPTGVLVYDAGPVNAFKGGGAIGVTYGAGNLLVYDDRVEFHKTSGSHAGFALGPVAGLALSKFDAKKNPVDTWYYNEIEGVHTAKHAGIIKKVVLQFRGGKALSFTLSGHGTATNQKVEELCNVISQYLR